MSLQKWFLSVSLLVGFVLYLSASNAQFPPEQRGRLGPQPPQGEAGCSVDQPSCTDVAPKIISSALGPSPLEDNLRHLTDEIGGRVTGSPAAAKAVEWAVEAFRQAGVDDVHTESFTVPVRWSEVATRLDVLAPLPFPVRLVAAGWSPATPAAGIEADVVDVGEGGEEGFARAGDTAKGAIVLVHTKVLKTWDDLFEEYDAEGTALRNAQKTGARAMLWMGSRGSLVLYRHTLTNTGELLPLPEAIVAREDALRMARFLGLGATVRVRLVMTARIGGPFESENVVAEIRGREKPGEFVVLGAHLDSWDLGTGALDNGCNAALVIDAARAIHSTGVRPRRTIRFILFTGEEQGMLGSWAYVRAHRAELDRADAVIVFDAGIGRTTGYELGGRGDIEAAVRDALKPAESLDANNHTLDAEWGTDHFDFLLEGVPTLVAIQEPANYMPNYHAYSDTFDKVNLRLLKPNVGLAAVAAYALADRAERLGKRQTRAEIEQVLEQTALEKQMKSAGVWQMWVQGKRGRQP